MAKGFPCCKVNENVIGSVAVGSEFFFCDQVSAQLSYSTQDYLCSCSVDNNNCSSLNPSFSTFFCLSQKKKISKNLVNDNYCDCGEVNKKKKTINPFQKLLLIPSRMSPIRVLAQILNLFAPFLAS
jgi:hypothetical protein